MGADYTIGGRDTMKVLFVISLIFLFVAVLFRSWALVIIFGLLLILSVIGEAVLTVIRKKQGGKSK